MDYNRDGEDSNDACKIWLPKRVRRCCGNDAAGFLRLPVTGRGGFHGQTERRVSAGRPVAGQGDRLRGRPERQDAEPGPAGSAESELPQCRLRLPGLHPVPRRPDDRPFSDLDRDVKAGITGKPPSATTIIPGPTTTKATRRKNNFGTATTRLPRLGTPRRTCAGRPRRIGLLS